MLVFFRCFLLFLLVLLLTTLPSPRAAAQSPAAAPLLPAAALRPDSLRRALAHLPADTQQLHRLFELLQQHRREDPRVVRLLAETGLELARRLDHTQFQIRFQIDLGAAYVEQGDFVGATRAYQQALRLADVPRWRARSYATRAAVGLGNVAGNEGDFRAATQHFRRALAYSGQMTAGPMRLTLAATSEGSLLQAYVARLGAEGQVDSLLRPAVASRQRLLQLAAALEQQGNPRDALGHRATAWQYGSALFTAQGQPDSAMAQLRRAVGAFRRLGAPIMLLTSQQRLANLLNEADQPAAAAGQAREALALARQMGATQLEADLLETLALSLDRLGDGHGAYRAEHRALGLRDSLLSADKRTALAEMQVRFDTHEKERRIQALTQRQRVAALETARVRLRAQVAAGVAGGLLLLLGAGGWLFARLRRAQQRLQHLTQLKDQLFAIIGHDLRGPVAGFRQVVPLLYGFADQPDPAEQRELALAFDQTSGQLADLLDNLLHWGRVQTQALTVRPEAVDVAALLRAEARLAQPAADAKQVRLRVTAAGLPPLLTDPTLLRVVVRNLLTNALKYSAPGGEVLLGAEAAGSGGVALTVQDTGVGMNAVTLAAVLGEAAPTESRQGTAGEAGTGLGLRVARAFARELGAALSAVSQPGAGTTFRLALPAGG